MLLWQPHGRIVHYCISDNAHGMQIRYCIVSSIEVKKFPIYEAKSALIHSHNKITSLPHPVAGQMRT